MQMICTEAKCGGTGNPSISSAPFEDPWCGADPDTYPVDTNPINKNNNCLYLHNLVNATSAQGAQAAKHQCQQCGWPGRPCTQECIYPIEWNPIGLAALNVGTYRTRGDLRNVRASPVPPPACFPAQAMPHHLPVALLDRRRAPAVMPTFCRCMACRTDPLQQEPPACGRWCCCALLQNSSCMQFAHRAPLDVMHGDA
jgi:hypothetical protein